MDHNQTSESHKQICRGGLVSNIHAEYTDAILFILDGISPAARIQLKQDLKLKLDRAYELQPSTLQGLKALERIMKASDLSRQIES